MGAATRRFRHVEAEPARTAPNLESERMGNPMSRLACWW